MNILKTSRLILRTWTLNDIESASKIWGDTDVMKFVNNGEVQTSELIHKSIEAGIKHQNKFGFQHWAVFEIETNNLIGSCGFNKTENHNEIELVFHFSKQSWGKGFATEAARSCVDHAIHNIRPSKIIAGCHPDNLASKNVLTKVGFEFVGNKWFEDTHREEPCYEIAVR